MKQITTALRTMIFTTNQTGLLHTGRCGKKQSRAFTARFREQTLYSAEVSVVPIDPNPKLPSAPIIRSDDEEARDIAPDAQAQVAAA